jgi:diguanylate cyclase (GGDEF)-like protein
MHLRLGVHFYLPSWAHHFHEQGFRLQRGGLLGGDETKMAERTVPPANPGTPESSQLPLDVILEALDASEDGIAIWKVIRGVNQTVQDYALVLMNDAGASVAGKPKQELIGKTLTAVVGVETSVGLRALFSRALSEGRGVKEIVPTFDEGAVRGAYENTVVPFGKDLVFATYRDVSESVEERERLIWLSEHDYLTGIPNRSKLQASLDECVSTCKQTGSLFGFVFIDIDYFKNVNDTYGHGVGDALLVNFVKRIRHSLPETALVARISGDEFAILLKTLKGEEQLRELMNEVFSSMARPFVHDEIEISVTCSAGCVLNDGSEHPDEIMRISDKAMYEAKHKGRARYVVQTVVNVT